MKNILQNSGAAGTGLIDPSNNNFADLYEVNSIGIQNFLSKLNNKNLFKSPKVRISIIGDSIMAYWNGSPYSLEIILTELFPDRIADIEFKNVIAAGTGSNYILPLINEIIGFNPDLIIFAEWETGANQAEAMETMLSLLKQKTSADIALFPWSIYASDMAYLSANNLTAYLASSSHYLRKYFYGLRQKYNCGLIDPTKKWIELLRSGEKTSADLLVDNIHPTDEGLSYWPSIIESHINVQFDNEYQNKQVSKLVNTFRLYDAVNIPDLTKFVKSGTWASSYINTDKTQYAAQSNSAGAYLQGKINGIGFELSYFGSNVGAIGILIDGVAPNTLIKDYDTPAIRTDGFASLKVIVDSNLLSNNETSRQFSITMTSATAYTVRDVTNNTVLGTGNISTDGVFSVTGGQITIPSNYCGVTNYRVTPVNGTVYTFYVKKNWYNTVDVTANNLTNVVRIFGLERGEHTVRLTCNSGTISLDSILELR